MVLRQLEACGWSAANSCVANGGSMQMRCLKRSLGAARLVTLYGVSAFAGSLLVVGHAAAEVVPETTELAPALACTVAMPPAACPVGYNVI
jgi:hypothetical protein